MNYTEYSDGIPQTKELIRYEYGLPIWAVNVFVEKVDSLEGVYKYTKVILPRNEWSKDSITNALIRVNYPQDKMEATINNYMLAQAEEHSEVKTVDKEEAERRFIVMQEWRKKCKKIAEEIIDGNNLYNSNNSNNDI